MTELGIILVLAGIILLLSALAQMAQNKSFENSQLVTGVVIDRRKHELKNGIAYELTVSYKVKDIEYTKTVGVTLTVYNNIHEGDNFDLRYRPDKPHKSINPDGLDPKKARGVLIFGAVTAAIGVVLLILGRFL